jgi:hypothetical protein
MITVAIREAAEKQDRYGLSIIEGSKCCAFYGGKVMEE